LFGVIVLCQRFRIDIPAPRHHSDNNPDQGDGQVGDGQAHEHLPRFVLPEEDGGDDVSYSRNNEYHAQARPTGEDAAWDHKHYLNETTVTFLELCGSIMPKRYELADIRTVVRRRLGDRWYESETHRDKDGKETERETWHNVADDEIDGFKEEWSRKHQKPAPPPQPAIESPEQPKPTTE
jgi:hypothetical protein